jgi:hypothetical protein
VRGKHALHNKKNLIIIVDDNLGEKTKHPRQR